MFIIVISSLREIFPLGNPSKATSMAKRLSCSPQHSSHNIREHLCTPQVQAGKIHSHCGLSSGSVWVVMLSWCKPRLMRLFCRDAGARRTSMRSASTGSSTNASKWAVSNSSRPFPCCWPANCIFPLNTTQRGVTSGGTQKPTVKLLEHCFPASSHHLIRCLKVKQSQV